MDNLLSCLFTALTVDGSLGQHIVANEIAHHVAVHSEELSECIGLRKLCVVVRILIVLDKLSHLGIEADVEVALTDEEYAALKGQAENREALIEDLSAYKASTNRQYANDYAALLRTEERRRARQKQYGKKQPVGAPSYDIAAFEAQGFDLPLGGGDGNG